MDPAEILIVDDDVGLRTKTARYLAQFGFNIAEAGSGEEMRARLARHMPDLVILDLRLPDAYGLDLAKDLRADPVVGLIITTGSPDDHDKIVGLEIGADDYLNKPVDPRELLARIRSTLRRVQMEVRSTGDAAAAGNLRSFAHLRLDTVAHTLADEDGAEIRLTSHEFRLLAYLVENPSKVISREQLMTEIYGRKWLPTDRSIDTLVAKIRGKIEREPARPNLIKTVRGTGYVFTARTRTLAE